MNREKLLQIFDYLNERLKESQLQLEITIYCDSIMTMVYDIRPAIKEIDCVCSETNSMILDNILDMTKFTFGLKDGWINYEIKGPLKEIIREDIET